MQKYICTVFKSRVYKSILEKEWRSTPAFLPGKPHEERSLAGYSPWGSEEDRAGPHTHT